IEEVRAGDLAAAIGLKDTKTGDTLCDEGHPIILEAMKFPEPVISVAIEPKTKADQDKLSIALQKLSEEDPTFRVHSDAETAQTIISGMGELHLEVLVERMKREFKVDANVGRPQVAYRETVRKRVEEVEGTVIRQTGGRGQYGHVVINMEPGQPGTGFVFEDNIVGGAIPREYIGPVEQGVKEALENGVLAGYPMVDVKVELVDGSYHDVDSSEMAFKIAGSMAVKEAARKAHPVLLEPIMDVEVVTPSDYMGDVIGDLSSRRGKDGGADESRGGEGARDLRDLRPGRQGVRVPGAARRDQDPHDRNLPRGVLERAAPLRARGLPGPRRLREEHDHRGGADGRRDPRGVGGGRADAADARAHPLGAPGERAGHRRIPEQVRSGGRRRAARPGGARGAGALVEVRVPGRRRPDDPRLRAQGHRRRQAMGSQGVGPAHGARQEHSGAQAGGGQAVPDAGGGRVLHHGARHGGHGADRPGEDQGGRGSGDGG